jgi:hypothetical protein
MKLLITKEIDEHKIITGIQGAGGLIDPEASRKNATKAIKKSATAKEIGRLKSQIEVYAKQMIQASRNTKFAKTDAEKRKFADEYKLREGQLKELEKEIMPLAVKIKKEFQQAVRDNAEYFRPCPGEEIVEDAEAENIKSKMIAATQAGTVLNRDLKQIVDYRGKKYWKKISGKWQYQEISKIGIEPASGSIAEADLTETNRAEITEQAETARIAALKPADRQAEKEAVIAEIASQAGIMKNTLEVQGDENALEKTRTWLAEETAKVEAKYK